MFLNTVYIVFTIEIKKEGNGNCIASLIENMVNNMGSSIDTETTFLPPPHLAPLT